MTAALRHAWPDAAVGRKVVQAAGVSRLPDRLGQEGVEVAAGNGREAGLLI